MWVPYIYSTNRINSNMCSVTVAVQTKGLEINACKKWGEGTLRNLFVLLCLLCTLPKPESWPIKYKIIYYINYTWEPFSLVMPTVGVHPSLKPDSRLAEEAAAVCVWVWLSVCGWISTAQPCYSPCGPGPQAVPNVNKASATEAPQADELEQSQVIYRLWYFRSRQSKTSLTST